MALEPPKTFYWYFKPIAVLCKFMGIFPLQNILSAKDPKDLKVKIVSFAQLYSLIIFGSIIYMIYFFSGFLFSRHRSVYLMIVVYVMMARSFLCFWFCEGLSKKLPILIRLLDSFDKKKFLLFPDRVCAPLRYFFVWTLIPMIVGLLCFGFSFGESSLVVLETIPPELGQMSMRGAAYFFGALSIWQVVPLLMYIYFSLKITCNFNFINNTIISRGYSGHFFDETIKYPQDMHLQLESLRFLHNMSTQTVQEMGKFYGNFMAIDQLCVVVMVVVNICTFMYEGYNEGHLMVLTFFNVLIVVAMMVISHEITESGTKVIQLLHGIVFSKINEETRTEIQTFMLQINACPPAVSAAGYFLIDKRQIPSIMSSVATYLVAVVQFNDQAKLLLLSQNCSSAK